MTYFRRFSVNRTIIFLILNLLDRYHVFTTKCVSEGSNNRFCDYLFLDLKSQFQEF